MTEMVLALPLLFVILALLIFLGRGVVRWQRTWVMDRYEAWHQAASAPGPGADGGGNGQINELFFAGRAESIAYDGANYFPPDATLAWIDAASSYSGAAGDLAQQYVAYTDAGRSVTFVTRLANHNVFWERFARDFHHNHTRIGHNWAHVNGWTTIDDQWQRAAPYGPNPQLPVRDVFFPDFDANFAAAAENSTLAQAIRRIYLAQPAYRGPQ